MSAMTQTAGGRLMPDPTARVRVSDGDELDVWVIGEGTPVVLVHGAVMRDFLVPLAHELTSRGDHQVIHYGRRGHGGRGLPAEATDIPGQVPDVLAVLDALGVDNAHVAGHSLGGYIALELACRAPDRVLSALLLEPLFGQVVRSTEGQEIMRTVAEVAMPAIVERYRNGDRYGAVSAFYAATSRVENARESVERALPRGARELAVTDLATFLQVDWPAMGAWLAEPVPVPEPDAPIVWIGSTDSGAAFDESRAYLQEQLPRTTAYTVADVGHYFPLLKPAETAVAVHEWLSRRQPA
ncbi:alpha/beta hydrolase [Georgenia sp. EYE_87]|uniref:alpha/beta fold hydrolase n=1 Tax=Georgenia sp. EYE_87 TaxID=2853448 RepID=UPI0020069BF8|nr:alpha/beta hydrolase [Georgenia sp. EYE_87]MCK6209090.1 alpha/beta hydrolase [Georgenia sp. EYE_87]